MISLVKSLIVLFVVFLLSGCSWENQKADNKSTIRTSLQNQVAIKSKQKHDVNSSGFGFWGPDNYQELVIYFTYHNLVGINEARYLIVDIAAIFLEEVNNDEKIRPYLSQYPYKIENLSIAIFPSKPDYEKPVHPDYMLIDLSGGKISYKTKEEGQRYGYHSEKTETFEEALEKLREQGRVPEYFKDYPKSKE